MMSVCPCPRVAEGVVPLAVSGAPEAGICPYPEDRAAMWEDGLGVLGPGEPRQVSSDVVCNIDHVASGGAECRQHPCDKYTHNFGQGSIKSAMDCIANDDIRASNGSLPLKKYAPPYDIPVIGQSVGGMGNWQ